MLGNIVLGKLNSLSELGSTGKSGSFFYFTDDSKDWGELEYFPKLNT
jgi:hypothetical protein